MIREHLNHSTTKSQVADKLFELNLIHTLVILLNSDFNETSNPFRENSNVTILYMKVKGCIASKRGFFVGSYCK